MPVIRIDENTLEWRKGGGKTVEIVDIEVRTERRVGIGRHLFQRLLQHQIPSDTRLIYAITRHTNRIAQQFYEALGFRVVGVLREFYQDEAEKCVDAIMYGYDVVKV